MAQSLVIACSSTPTALAGIFGGGSVHGYIRVRLKSLTGTCYLGDSGVTTGGYPFSTADAPIEVNLLTGESLWAASSSGGTPTLVVLRTGETS
jgi:hypothetical protein